MPVFAFMIPGLREVVLVAIVATALYGRSGTRLLMATRYGRSLSPWFAVSIGSDRPPVAARLRLPPREPPRGNPSRPGVAASISGPSP